MKEKHIDYDSLDDIENQNYFKLSTRETNFHSDSEIEEKRLIKTSKIKKIKELKKGSTTSLQTYRITNSISIIFLLITFLATIFSKINYHKSGYFILEKVSKQALQSEVQFAILNLAFFFVSCKI
jgi:hypothetical protein